MRSVLAVTTLLFVLTGCAPTPSEPTPPQKATPVAEAPVTEPPDGQSEPILVPAPVPSAGELKIDILDWEQTQAIVADHPGKVVVFDLWSTSCPPCLRELPGLVALQNKYPDSVVCVSVSLDFDGDPKIPPSQLEPAIREVLEQVQAHKVRNVLLSTSYDDLFKVIEHQSMPIAYIFDQTGKRVVMFPDRKDPVEFTYAGDITPAVEKLLAEPAQP